jgi:hypothetical protein
MFPALATGSFGSFGHNNRQVGSVTPAVGYPAPSRAAPRCAGLDFKYCPDWVGLGAPSPAAWFIAAFSCFRLQIDSDVK